MAYGCHNQNQKENKKPRLFRFPNNDPELRQKWINACKREKNNVKPRNPSGKNALEKIKKLEKKHLSYEKVKGNHAKFKYYIGINVQVFDCLFDYLQAEKDIEAAKKN